MGSVAHETTTLRAITKLGKGKEDNNARPTRTSATALNKRLSAHQSATSARQELDKFTILCDSQKHTTCLDIHYNACLKHFNFLHRQNTVCPTAVHVSSSCCTLHIHACTLSRQSHSESDSILRLTLVRVVVSVLVYSLSRFWCCFPIQ